MSSHSEAPFSLRAIHFDSHGAREINSEKKVVEAWNEKEGITWIHLVADDKPQSKIFLTAELGLSELEVDDALSEVDRVAFHDLAGWVFFSIPAIVLEEDDERYIELGVFVFPHGLVSVSKSDCQVVGSICQHVTTSHFATSPSSTAILHLILDAIVDEYFPAADRLQEALANLEDQIFEANAALSVREGLGLKKRLLAFRKRVSPIREAINALLRRDDLVAPSLWPYFHDVYDHSLRLVELADLGRDIFASIMDAQLTITSNRLNESMRFMTVVATILMSVTLIASVYGMNFKGMPEIDSPWGYPAAIVAMIVIGLAEWAAFRKKGWV